MSSLLLVGNSKYTRKWDGVWCSSWQWHVIRHPFACKPTPTSRSAYDSWCLAIVRTSSSTEMLADVAATAIAAAITISLESDCSAKQQSMSPTESTYRDSTTSLD